MTGPEGAPAVPARPDEQAVAEALRWFRENPTLIDEITGGQLIEYVLVAQKHAATIVRAALAGARPAAEPDESMTDAERAIAPFLAWVENFRKNAPELGQALRQRLDEIRATLPEIGAASPLPTGTAHQPDGEEVRMVELALRCAETGEATHWPTAAAFLAQEIHRLRSEVAELRAAGDALAEALNDLLTQLPGYMGPTAARAERETAIEADNAWRSAAGSPATDEETDR